jgi:hypothetical protein
MNWKFKMVAFWDIRWLESIEEDLRKIGVGIWKRMAMD